MRSNASLLFAFVLGGGLISALPLGKEEHPLAERSEGVADAIDPPWYNAKAERSEGVADAIDPPWYNAKAERSEGVTDAIDPPWYNAKAERSEGVADAIDPPWYNAKVVRSEGVADAIDPPWYNAKAERGEGVVNGVDRPWYDPKAKRVEGVADTVDYPLNASEAEIKRRYADPLDTESKLKDEELQRRVFGNMRSESLRSTSEKGKDIFTFTAHPKNDTVDRWHIPEVLRVKYNTLMSDADRVSVLNNYLYTTARAPKPASELGFTPTMSAPGLPEGGNEVGYGYALDGQHQYHCADILADAIEIGKSDINNFYLRHVIHCLSLIKTLATKLKDPQPLALLTPKAEMLIKAGVPKTISGLASFKMPY